MFVAYTQTWTYSCIRVSSFINKLKHSGIWGEPRSRLLVHFSSEPRKPAPWPTGDFAPSVLHRNLEIRRWNRRACQASTEPAWKCRKVFCWREGRSAHLKKQPTILETLHTTQHAHAHHSGCWLTAHTLTHKHTHTHTTAWADWLCIRTYTHTMAGTDWLRT